jgi:hypothetical protein
MAGKKKKTTKKKVIKPIKEVITSKTEVVVEEPQNLLELKDNKDLDVLKKYQKDLKVKGFKLTDGRIM